MHDNYLMRRLTEAFRAAGWPPPTEQDVAEASGLADEFEREMESYPFIHAWATKNGSQLQFWCRYCNRHHFHGRHSGPSHADVQDSWDIENNWVPRLDAVLPLRLWRRHLQRFRDCRYDDRYPGGRGLCTCPVGSGDGHRSPHCGNRDGEYYSNGYILHEVHPNDDRALRKPNRNRRGM
jgi:hypothetical protein